MRIASREWGTPRVITHVPHALRALLVHSGETVAVVSGRGTLWAAPYRETEQFHGRNCSLCVPRSLPSQSEFSSSARVPHGRRPRARKSRTSGSISGNRESRETPRVFAPRSERISALIRPTAEIRIFNPNLRSRDSDGRRKVDEAPASIESSLPRHKERERKSSPARIRCMQVRER